jgi:plastocyanin
LLKVKIIVSTENMSMKKSNTGWIIAGVIIVIVIIVVGVVAYQQLMPSSTASPSPTETPFTSPTSSTSTSNIDIYAGEVSTSTYGFGNSASTIESPGPTLTFTAGETVTVTLHNASPSMVHNWAIVDTKSATGTVLWNAQIASASNPVSPGSSSSVTFTVGSAGSYYYICQVDAHVTLGMWGTVTVNP